MNTIADILSERDNVIVSIRDFSFSDDMESEG